MQIKSLKDTSLYTNLSKRDAQSATALIDLGVRLIHSILDNSFRTDNLRKVVYNLKDKFGYEKIQHAAELQDTPVLKDVIGFGSVKDLMDLKRK